MDAARAFITKSGHLFLDFQNRAGERPHYAELNFDIFYPCILFKEILENKQN